MPSWKLTIFTNATITRMRDEGLTAEEVLATYPKLTEEEKQEILAAVNNKLGA